MGSREDLSDWSSVASDNSFSFQKKRGRPRRKTNQDPNLNPQKKLNSQTSQHDTPTTSQPQHNTQTTPQLNTQPQRNTQTTSQYNTQATFLRPRAPSAGPSKSLPTPISGNQTQHNIHMKCTTTMEMSRLQFSSTWEKFNLNPNVEIIKTKFGFLLKSNTSESEMNDNLKKLREAKIVKDFNRTTERPTLLRGPPAPSYSAVIHSVELEIGDDDFSNHLTRSGIQHRFCKRIISRATQNATRMLRIITACHNSYQKLLHDKILYKHKVYRVEQSQAPAPLPIPCAKCTAFDHTTENCTAPVVCGRCSGAHSTSKCNTELPEKCKSCGMEGHGAWSTRCKKRPMQPIEGIPNVKLRSTNNKTCDIDSNTTKKSRIHSPITIHDHIIDTYITKLNSPKTIDRNALIKKLKDRFIEAYRVDTVVSISGNRIFIVMFDLLDPEIIPPVSPTDGVRVSVSRNG